MEILRRYSDTFAGRVGYWAWHLRQAQGLSGRQAAEAAGLPKSTWYVIEAGESPRAAGQHLEAVSAGLGVPMARLLREIPAKHRAQ